MLVLLHFDDYDDNDDDGDDGDVAFPRFLTHLHSAARLRTGTHGSPCALVYHM